MKIFRLPEFPPPLSYHYVQNYYSDMAASLGKAINVTPPEESALLARYCEKLIESEKSDICVILDLVYCLFNQKMLVQFIGISGTVVVLICIFLCVKHSGSD